MLDRTPPEMATQTKTAMPEFVLERAVAVRSEVRRIGCPVIGEL